MLLVGTSGLPVHVSRGSGEIDHVNARTSEDMDSPE